MLLRRNTAILTPILVLALFILTPDMSLAQLKFDKPVDNGGPLVAGEAKRASASRWPATRIFESKIGGCTTTLVGPRAILTAAHCVENGASAKMKHRGKWVTVTACSHHPKYDGENSWDYALCALDEEITNVPFEIINTSRSYPREGHELAFLGYGCISDPNNNEVIFSNTNRALYGGVAPVVARFTNTTTYIKTTGKSVGCFGDSGGAAYVQFSNGRREIVGVMSRALVAKDGVFVGDTYISTTSHIDFVTWSEDWVDANGAAICGISLDARNCRS